MVELGFRIESCDCKSKPPLGSAILSYTHEMGRKKSQHEDPCISAHQESPYSDLSGNFCQDAGCAFIINDLPSLPTTEGQTAWAPVSYTKLSQNLEIHFSFLF